MSLFFLGMFLTLLIVVALRCDSDEGPLYFAGIIMSSLVWASVYFYLR